MVKGRRSPRGWVLKGIDPNGAMVRRIQDIAAGEGLTVDAWVERWLSTVLRHHYVGEGGATTPGARPQVEDARAAMRRNLEILGNRLSRLHETVERTHRTVARAEATVSETESGIKDLEDAIGKRR